ncbi:peptide deformylase [Phyllobacterium zundukense]|uniref:Peptide deformylase-like n=1 Tax=Phyllobacterium zundukense TaxID=1867719 RepID=A0A2N9VZ45_9HYPH|nr:peptide deformylase [Phyllobacterium zundukense]ATU90978.1 peptide deformylase [Phyllobacterium zundukense]PIO44763.1 peptide deformylase [Phyllobacterium zundukense]
MTIRTILRFPHPALRLHAEPVTEFGDDVRILAQDLLATMRGAPGIGITAPHIGVLKRLVVIELDQDKEARFYINPEIEWASAEIVRHEEGSVSMPGVSDEIERSSSVRVRYQDLSGALQTEEATGLLSICLQHEIDQLDGLFWIYRLSKLKRDRLIKRFEKLQRASKG